jgi:tetratricopeptide (TPR) repeat protein
MRAFSAFVLFTALTCCLPAHAAVWGRYYIPNDWFGHCADPRLSPDARIANCAKATRSGMLNLKGELFELNDLAYALEDKSDYAGAVMVLTKALSMAEHNWIPNELYLRGQVYLKMGNSELATADFNAMALTFPSFSYAGLAEVAAVNGRFNDAIQLYDKAIALNDRDNYFYGARANIYARMGEYQKAMKDDDTVVNEYPEIGFPYNGRCWDRAVLGRDLDDALADCTRALDLQPDDPNAFDSLGMVRFRQGKWDDAITAYNSALSHNPYFAQSLFMRGLSELRKGDTAKGQADVAQAEAINPRISEEYVIYGITP